MAERPLYTLYKNLKAQNYDVPDDYNKFESALTRDGKGGADNRHAIYENLKAQNFDVPNTYERFYSALFEPRSKTSSRAKVGSVPMSAADRARFSAGAAAISASAQHTMNNAGRYNRLKQRKQKQQKDFGRVNLGTHQTPYGGDANNVVKDDFAYNPETGKAGAYVSSDNENVYSQPEAEQKQAVLDQQNNAYQEAVDTGEIPSVFDVRDKNGNYDLQENINKNGTYLTEEGARNQFDKKLADAYARKKEIEAAIAEDHRLHGNPLLSYGASIGASNGRTAEQSDYSNKLATSLALVKQQIGALEAVKQYPTSSWGEDALKALDNTAFTAKTWDFGLTDFATMGQMERIKTKMDNNLPLSGSDKMLLKSKLGADAAAALEDEKMGNIYRWTKIAGQSLPFMADFFLTGGYGGITKAISRGALKFAAKRGMGKVSAAILKNTGIVAGDVIGSYAMAGSEQAMKTGADIMQRHLGSLYQDEKGDYKFGTFDENGNLLHEGGESMGTALYKGLTSAMVENYTEKLFGHSYGIKKGAINFMEKHGMNASAEFFKNIGKSGWYANSKKWMEKFGINGFGEEVMEEEIGIPLHALLDGDNKFSDLLDAKQQLDIIGGMALSVGSMYAMGAGSRPVKGIYNRAQYYRFRNKVNVADSDAQNLIGDKWEDIKDKIDNTTNEQMGGVLADILRQRDTMSKDQINAAINYGINLMKMRGYNVAKTAEMNAREITNEPTTPEEQHQEDIDNAYSEGHDADDADKHDIQLEHEDQMKTLAGLLNISEQQLSAMNDDELQSLTGQNDRLDQAIYDYQLSSARYQGVTDDAQDKIDMAANQAAQRVDMYTDKSRGSVRNATVKASGGAEDYGVYIISGNIATNEDGSINVADSDDMILFYDPTTNSVEHADALRFAELGDEVPADDVKAQAVADAKEKAIKEVAGIVDGTIDVGSQFSVTDADGTEHTYEVLADYGDGTAAISIDGNVVENPYQLADLQQMKDMEDQKRLEAAKAQREQMEKERAEQTQETELPEETQPSFDFNQILNDNGNVVLVDVLDKDGNTKYPDSKLFLIRDTGAKAKVVEMKSDGTFVPHAVSKKNVATISSMSLDEYKQAMAETSMVEENSGAIEGDRGGIEVNDELPPVPDNVTINGDGTYSVDGAVKGGENTTAPAEQTEQTPAMTLEDGTIVPMLEDGNPDFSKLTADQTAELYDSQFGEDADSVISGWVSDAKKALDKANNMTVKGKNFVEQKAAKEAKEKAIADAQTAYDSAVAIRDAYNERQLAKVEDTADGRKNLIEKARRKFSRLKSAVNDDAEAVSQLYKDVVGSLLHRLYDGTGIDVTDTIPLTAEEYVASNLGAHSLNYEGTETSKGVKQETGLSREDFAKTQLLAADGKGTTIDDLVHSLWENRPSNLESLDTQDIRNALIGVLTSGFKASEARNYIENLRIAQAKNILEEQKKAADNAAFAEEQKAKQEEEEKKAEENAEEKAEEKTHSESFNKIVDLAKNLEKILDNPDNVKEIDKITHEIDELLETLSDEEFKEVSDVLLNIDEDLEYLTADEYERREGVEESKKAKAYNESLQQAIKRIAPYADALKAAVKSGDKKAIAKAQKELTDALLASNLGHGYLSSQLAQAKMAKKKDETYSENRAFIKPLTDAINAIESALDSAIADVGLEGVHVDFKDNGYGWIYADKGSAWSSRLKALDNDYRNVSQYETQNPISVLPQVTMDNVENVAGIIKSRIEEGERYNSDEINDEENENINEQTNENINAPEVPEDATDENPLGAQREQTDLPFSAKENGKQQTTAERAADVEKNKVDDMKVVDNIVGEKTRKAFERLAKMMGASIQWQYSDKLGNGWIHETTDADGNVHRTIFITLDSSITEGAQFIFGHEMTHQIKNLTPAAYKELTQLVLDTYGSDAFDKAVDETMQRYSDAGFSGRDREYYAEEVVADAVGEMIRDLNLAHTLAMKMSHPLLAAIHEILQKIKLAFFGTEYSDVTKNIIRSIEQAYVKTANGEVTNSETGEDVSFSLRQKPEPKKKGIGYKVFVLKDGKLYPPMVANPDGAATPVGVWLDADAAPIAGESKTGRPQVKQGGKGTQGGSGKLAYRPGWHLGVVPYAIQFNRKDAEGNKTLFPKNFVFAEVEYAADVDYQEEARQEGINPSGKYQHSLAGLKHLPTDGYYMYRTNPNPETDPWVITGAMKVNRILTRAEQAELVKNAGREPQQIQEGDIVTDDVVNSINQEIADAPKFSLKSKPVRFEAGKKLSDEEKKEVLSTLKDAYKVNGVPYHIEETAGGKEKRVYEPTADSYVVSDITNRPLRYYITLPDGRVAHPTEVYPNISDNEVKSSATKQGLLDEEVDQIVSAAIGNMKDIADNAKAVEILNELQNLPHETHDVGYGLNHARSYNYKTGIFTSDAAQAIDYVVRRMRRKEDVPAEIPAALKKAVADSYGMVDNLIDGMINTKVGAAEIKPVGVGAFGNIYNQFRGNAKAAIEFLKKVRGGEAVGALHHKDIGDIDLVWGKEGTGHSDGYGLSKLVKYHPEVLDNLQEILNDMRVVSSSKNRVNLESETHKAGVRLTWDGERKSWLLTAFKKETSASDKRTDTAATSLEGDTALSQTEGSAAKIDNSSETAKENGEKFSLKDEKTMFGMHNISIDKLRKAIKQGGFAAPSMGVVDSKNGIYSDYGEITLIPKAEKLAKRTGKNAGTFTADAWTPTYPQVERIMNKQGEKVFNTDMNEKLGDVDNGIYSNIRESWKGYLSSGDVRDGLYWHYLFDKGMNPETIYQTGKYDNDITNEVMRISDNGNKTDYTDEEVKELIQLMNKATGEDNDVDAQREKLKARIASAEKQGNHLLVALKKKRLAELEGVENFYIAADFVKDVVRNNRKNGKVDVHDTMSVAKEKVENDKKLSADFPSWLDKKTEEYGVEEMLYNGTTPSGKPKYIPNTIDNAVKLMKKQGVAGGYTAFGSELGVFIAKNSPEVNTLAAMKNAKDKLIPFGDERHNQIKDKITKEFLELSDEIRVGSNNRYALDDSGVSRMVELTDHKGNEKEYLKKAYNVEVSDEWMDRYNKLLDTIKKDYKVFYFETKFMRPYGLDEFEKAIVPSDTPSDVVDALKKAGIDVSSYERGNAEDRQKVTMDAINSSDNIRFSLKEEKEKIVADAKANGTYMTAPNGEKTKLDAEQWATVRTTNFKNWFGDWENDPENASKVVDENGEPMVVWHGRSAEFNTFEKKEGVRFIMGLEDKVKAEGFFFSPDKGLAEEFASNSYRHRGGKANVVPCFLNIRRPMDLTGEDFDRIYEDVTGWEYMVGMDTQDNLWGIMDEEGMADKIKEKGYDGAIFVEEVDDSYEPTKISYCALDANQIKSAENNNGDFSSGNNDIRFSLKSMMTKPEGWKQANKKAIHIAEAIERDPKFSLKNLDGTLIKAGTYFSGGGLVEEGLKGIIDPVVAVEYDEKISGVYRNNFGQHIVTADVRDVDPKELVKQIDGEVEYFHASPVCKNYSQAKSNHAEVELDKETAASTAEFINAVKPKVVTIENVKGYKDSEAMKIITDALDANGYTWDADVYNAADYGGYTNRERLIVRAVRDGKLPEKPKKMAHKSGWYEAVADIIPTLTEKKNGVAPWMDIRLKADGIDWRNIDKPLYVMGSAYADGKIPHAFADELLPTLRTKSGDVIVMPDGKVYRAMGRVLARVSGVSDDYKMPFSENLSHTIIGNGIPTQLTEHVIAPLLQNTLRPTTPEDGNTKFSLRYDKFEHDLNQWKKDNNLPKDAQRPIIPQRNTGESAVDFLRRVDEYRKQMALWKTAPTYEQHLLSDDTALGEFNRELQKGSVLKRIAFQDSMLAIRKAQEAIMKEVGVDRLNMAEDAYTAENRSHGKGKNEFEEYNNEFLQPLRKAYHQMKKVLGDSYDNVRVYMMAKHGLERDAQMAFKKSLEADYEDVNQRSTAYKAYKNDLDRVSNDADLEFGRVDFTTWRQKDNALRGKYSPSYMDYRYDDNGIAYDYSGLSSLFDGSDFEEAAHRLVRDVETKHLAEVQALWNATNAATKKILRDGFKAGMMSKDAYEYVKGMYSHYIPLRGWDGTTADQVWDYIGGGKGAFNQTLKTAHGRTSIADDPIAYIENMAESGILLNNKNWVKQHLMLLAQNHPTSLLTLSKAWYVKSTDANGNEEWIPATPQITSQMNSNQVKAAIDAFEQKMEQLAQTGDATQQRDGLNIAYPQTHSEEREHEVRVMKDGEEYVIYVNGDPQLAQAMNNTRAHRVREIQSGKLDRAAAWLGRKMAAAYTSLSPLFIPSNYFRDLTMTLASTAIREDGRYNYLLRKNLATSWNLGFMLRDYQNGKLREKVNNGNATAKEQMFYDFMMNGGETGFVSSLDVEDLKKKFKNDLKDLDRWKANPVKVGHTIMDGIEFLNRAIEDSNRFAVYMTSIQYGRSIDEAVNDAKDVTLNFNRKGTGEYGWQMIRNLYLFINPAVQSLQTLGALTKHHPFKFTAVTAAWLASGVLVPIVNAVLMSLLGGDDDKDKYWQFTKWDRRNNLIMWVPFTHEYVKIPLAQEFRAFYGVGDMIASKIMGGELAEETWSQYAEDLLGQVVDMLPLDPTGYDGNIAVSLMPNPIRPVFELAFNVDFTGKPLFKDTEYNKYDPNFTKAYVGTPDWLVRVSKMVNSIGNDYPDVQQNAIDAFGDPRYNLNNPAVVDHVLSSYLGGAYTMGSQVLGVLTKSLNDPKEIKMADIPLVSKFVSNPDDRPVTKKQGDEFWNMKENHDRAANTLSKLKKQAKVDGDYSMLERFYGSEEYKQYKQEDVKVKKYEEDKKKERAEESGEEYRPHKLNAEDIYKAHATPKDDFEDLKLKQLYTKLNGFKTSYDLLVDTAPGQSDGYYNTNKVAIDAIDEISLDKQEISELKKGFLEDGKDAYNAEDMKRIRELRKRILSVLEPANKVVVANQKAKAEKK